MLNNSWSISEEEAALLSAAAANNSRRLQQKTDTRFQGKFSDTLVLLQVRSGRCLPPICNNRDEELGLQNRGEKESYRIGNGIWREGVIDLCHIVQTVVWSLNFMFISCSIFLEEFL